MSRQNISVGNGDDIIDSRDIIARIEELDNELSDAQDHYGMLWDEDDEKQQQWTRDVYVADSMHEMHEDENEELRILKALEDEASGSSDWTHGETLIRDSYFESYAQQLAEDIGAYKDTSSWPGNYIDWGKAAEALQQDYTSVEFDGVTYWIRS